MECKIFYSWQSLSNSTNRGFIQSVLENVVDDLRKDDEVVVEPVVDRDTSGVPGSPDIGATILSKIEASSAFVCDVSIITPAGLPCRPTPNPNVMIELGYALKAVGQGRTLMVMNTAFGGPEMLPFDLKQKRVITYDLAEGADKSEAKKVLRSKLAVALKEVITSCQSAGSGSHGTKSPADEVIDAIRQARPDQDVLCRKYMEGLATLVSEVEPSDGTGVPDQDLVDAIEKTVPYADEFGRVAETATAMSSKESVVALCKGLEFFLARYDNSDLFKFIGHELCTILVAHLLKAERWPIIDEVARERFFFEARSGNSGYVGVEHLSRHSRLLDEVRTRRLATNGQRRISFHADILKSRHERAQAVGGIGWDDFLSADLFLLLHTFDGKDEDSYWWPRSAVFLGSHRPRFLLAASELTGSRRLAQALGEKDLAAMKAHTLAALVFLRKGMSQMGPFLEHDVFEPKIAVEP